MLISRLKIQKIIMDFKQFLKKTLLILSGRYFSNQICKINKVNISFDTKSINIDKARFIYSSIVGVMEEIDLWNTKIYNKSTSFLKWLIVLIGIMWTVIFLKHEYNPQYIHVINQMESKTLVICIVLSFIAIIIAFISLTPTSSSSKNNIPKLLLKKIGQDYDLLLVSEALEMEQKAVKLEKQIYLRSYILKLCITTTFILISYILFSYYLAL
jgi:hypothetical protein